VSVIVPTHDRHDLLRRLLDSLAKAEADDVVVVDDGSRPPVALPETGVTLVRHEQPEFLAAARNQGVAASSGGILVFIDDDCVVEAGAISHLATALRSPEIGIVGPLMPYLDASDRIWCAGTNHGRWTGLTRYRSQGRHTQEAFAIPRVCDDFPTAFAMRREVFEEVGGFDEVRYPIYMLEADIAERVRARGYRVELVPEARVYHDISPTAPLVRRLHVRDRRQAIIQSRDRIRFIRRLRLSRLQRLSQLVFWLLVLTPAYIVATLRERERSGWERLATVRGLLEGNWEGLVQRIP
jgi:GT2 family glycosyltransferase